MNNPQSRNLEAYEDDLPAESDEALLRDLLKDGVRSKYIMRYQEGMNLVKLNPDLADAFPTEKAVNDALRQFLKNKQLSA